MQSFNLSGLSIYENALVISLIKHHSFFFYSWPPQQ